MGSMTALRTLLDVRHAVSVAIHDTWTGYSAHAPITAAYELRRGPRGGLAGEARLSTAVAGERVVNVAIPTAAAARFLEAVAEAIVVPGPYEAMQDHTDDCPRIEVVFHVVARDTRQSGGIALLFTESQGQFHAPWGVYVGGLTYTLPGDEVGRALAAMRAPLKRGILDRMMKDPTIAPGSDLSVRRRRRSTTATGVASTTADDKRVGPFSNEPGMEIDGPGSR
jgi:hypothetical protein